MMKSFQWLFSASFHSISQRRRKADPFEDSGGRVSLCVEADVHDMSTAACFCVRSQCVPHLCLHRAASGVLG